MNADPQSQSSCNPQLERALAECLEAIESQGSASIDEWIEKYPQFSAELRELISNHQRLNRIVSRLPQSAVDVNSQTMLSGDAPCDEAEVEAPRVRYFGDYELLEEIARGGMGVVYRGRQVSLNRPVAVKMILSGELASADDVARFQLEAEAAANLDHPGIVPIYEIGENHGQHYFSMKLINGRSLAELLKAEGGKPPVEPREIRERVKLVVAVARAVHFAHQRGIIHRDLKPANILMDSDGTPHITDFGLAKSTSGDSALTHTGAIVGTPSYMSPEQATGGGKNVTTAADIYGLGAILYAVLTGRPPFEGETPIDTLLKVRNDPPLPLHQYNSAIEPDLGVVCLKCLAKNPDERYRSAGELADDLERWLSGEPIQAAPPNLTRFIGRWLSKNFRSVACVVAIGSVTGLLVCEPILNSLALNLAGYLNIYRGAFPETNPPRILEIVTSYPRWFSLVMLPILMAAYLGMGWLADRFVKPTNATGALMTGLGVGTCGAIVAFLLGIGWQTLIQEAVWPAEQDLRILGNAIDGEFVVGPDIDRVLTKQYPTLTADYHGRGRAVWKKAFVDIQTAIPRGLWIGFGFSVGLMLLPATAQTLAANYLRLRGDTTWPGLLHFFEMTMPASLAMASWGMLLWGHSLTALSLLLLPVALLLLTTAASRWSKKNRRVAFAIAAMTSIVWVVCISDAIFDRNSGGLSFGLMAPAAFATLVPIVQRWKWWERLPIHLVWIGALILLGGVIQFRATSDAPQRAHREFLISVCAALILCGAIAVGGWRKRVSMRQI